jgi:hypothetical protein
MAGVVAKWILYMRKQKDREPAGSHNPLKVQEPYNPRTSYKAPHPKSPQHIPTTLETMALTHGPLSITIHPTSQCRFLATVLNVPNQKNW